LRELLFKIEIYKKYSSHPGERRDPTVNLEKNWVPAFAGMTAEIKKRHAFGFEIASIRSDAIQVTRFK
jgi:hypothetical protein